MLLKTLTFTLILASMSFVTKAETLGPTYPILEPDLLKEIESSLREKEKSGELARKQREAIERSTHSAANPKAVEGLTRTMMPRTFYFDPTVVANQRIATPSGQVIVEPGQKFNPLDQVSLPNWLLFFDARDAGQVKKAEAVLKQSNGSAMPILTGGSYIEIQKLWKRPVYFDQAGVLIRKFGIRQIPALVVQDGKRLRVDELTIN